MRAEHDTKATQSERIFFIVVFLTLCIWAILQSQQSINPDNAYLTNAALRMLEGERMSEGYYDVNPPLSFLIYLPVALSVKYLSVSIYHAVFFFGLISVLLSVTALHNILKRLSTISYEEHALILGLYSVTTTIATMNFFAERDLFIALSIVPLYFLQQAITDKVPLPKSLKISVLCVAPIFLFLKPHYGLVPLCMFTARIIKNKNLSFIKDPDFLALIGAAIFYILILFIFFHDFLAVILPDILKMYVIQTEPLVQKAAFEYGFSLLLMILLSFLFFDKPYKNALILFIVSALCLSVYVIMNKGFLYQLIPFLIFFTLGTGLLLYKILNDLFLRPFSTKIPALFPLLTIFFLILFGIISALSPKTPFLTHQQYQSDTVVTLLKDKCRDDECSFFMFNDRIDIMHELSVYAQQPLASRFPTFFFLPFLIASNPSALPEPERTVAMKKYTDMIADDFDKYQPDTLLLGQFHLESENEFFDLKEFLIKNNPRFEKIFNQYNEETQLSIDQSAYTGHIFLTTKIIKYDFYTRKLNE